MNDAEPTAIPIQSATPKKRKPFSLKWRDALKIVQMNGEIFVCAYCTCELDLDTAEVDHIVPVSKGGSNDLDNLEIACRACNRQKGSRDLDYGLEYELMYDTSGYD